MLAYVFWHAPREPRHDAAYEMRLAAFHDALAGSAPHGFERSAAFRVEVPWLSGPGYEDWYLVAGWHDLGALNAAAVDAARRSSHDGVAGLAGVGAGGVFALRSGEPALAPGPVAWLHKPPGLSRPAFTAELGASAGDRGEVWERQLVLGPSPEYCVAGGDAPAGAPVVSREAVWP